MRFENNLRVRTAALLGSFVACSIAIAAEPANGVPDVEREPNHHVVFENSSIRILEVNIPAGVSSLFHRHRRDNVAVALTNASVANQLEGEPPPKSSLRVAGQVFYSAGDHEPYTHRVMNTGPTPYQLIDVELKQPVDTRATAGTPKPLPTLDNERVRASTYILAPGEQGAPLQLLKGVLVVLPGGSVQQITEGGALHASDNVRTWSWHTAGTYSLRNASSNSVTVIEIEIK